MIAIDLPFRKYISLNGSPLDGGYIYLGLPNQNPETAPATAYWDEAGTLPVSQPVRTVNGLIMHNGAIASLFVAGDYSITIRDSDGTLVCYAPTPFDFQASTILRSDLAASTGSAMVGHVADGVGAVPSNLQIIMRSAKARPDQFGDVSTDANGCIARAIAKLARSGERGILEMSGAYAISAPITFASSYPLRIEGDGAGSTMITPTGNFDVFSMTNSSQGSGIVGLGVNAAGMTGGRLLKAFGCDRAALSDLVILSPWSGFEIEKSNVTSIERVWVNAVRGAFGVYWNGTTQRSDVLNLHNLQLSCSANTVGATGLLVDGNVNTVNGSDVACTSMGRGLWCKNTSAGAAPLFVTISNFQADFPLNEGVRLEGGARGIFLPEVYLHGSATADGFYADSTTSNIDIDGGQIDSHFQRGVFADGRYTDIRANISNNSLAGSALWDGVVIGANSIGVKVNGGLSGQRLGYAANLQGYGVRVNAGAQAYGIVGVNLRGNVTGDFIDNANDATSVIVGNNQSTSTASRIPGPLQAMTSDLLLYGAGTNSAKLGNATNGTGFSAQASDLLSVNFMKAFGHATGGSPAFEAVGADTNLDFKIASKGTGQLQITNAGQFAANGAVATALAGVGPTGSRPDVQKWLVVKDQSGNPFYIPLF